MLVNLQFIEVSVSDSLLLVLRLALLGIGSSKKLNLLKKGGLNNYQYYFGASSL